MKFHYLPVIVLAAMIISAGMASAGFQLLTARQVCWMSVGEGGKVLKTAEKTVCDVNKIYLRPLGLRNPTNETINISLIPKGSLQDAVKLAESRFLLSPNETRYIDFELTVAKPGSHQLDILVKPEVVNPKGSYAGLSSEIIVYAKAADDNGTKPNIAADERKRYDEKESGKRQIMGAAIMLISFIILAKFYLLKSAKKKTPY